VIATAYAAPLFLTASKPALATSVTFPSSEFVGGAFHTPPTIIIAYFYICNNNFHFAK
jgi:hypothetical protein